VDVALSHAQTARRALPTVPNVADTLGWAFYHKGTYALAIPLFKEALKSAPENPTYHFHIGMTYQKSGDKVNARIHLQRALDLKLEGELANRARQALNELGS
jgi:Flp pilus assembly protein TadD